MTPFDKSQGAVRARAESGFSTVHLLIGLILAAIMTFLAAGAVSRYRERNSAIDEALVAGRPSPYPGTLPGEIVAAVVLVAVVAVLAVVVTAWRLLRQGSAPSREE